MKIAEPVSTLVSIGDDELETMTSRVDPDGARRVMDMLINTYSDPHRAVVREYLANAVDATIAAGSTDPVLVSVPTMLDPNLIITDHGTGMSAREVEMAFLAFAASTKRNSDDLIGGLGVGAKSAWTLAESFLIDTVKDGRRTMVRASRDLKHQVLLKGGSSDQPNGTTISIPVQTGYDWDALIRTVAGAHDPGRVLVNGKTVPSIAGGPTWIGPVACQGGSGSVQVRSGGTLFDAGLELSARIRTVTNLQGCIIELPIGAFDHTPSRETVIPTERTKIAVDRALEQFSREYVVLAARVVELAAVDITAAIALRRQTIGRAKVDSSFLPVPGHVRLFSLHKGGNYGGRGWGSGTEVALSVKDLSASMDRTMVITGKPDNRALRGFATWIAENHSHIYRIIVIPEGENSVAFPVTFDGSTKMATGQLWKVGAHTEGVLHYTFADFLTATNKRREHQPRTTVTYMVTLRVNTADTPEQVYLSAADIAGLDVPVWFTENDDNWPQHPIGGPASAGVALVRRKPGPLLAKVPGAISRVDWCCQVFAKSTAGWSRDTLLAARINMRYGTFGEHDFALHTAQAATGRMDRTNPMTPVVNRLAQIEAARTALTGEQKQTFAAGCAPAYQRLDSELFELRDRLFEAYPLLKQVRYFSSDSGLEPHLVEYVVHTPPITR